MKRLLPLLLLTLAFGMLKPETVQASHLAGAELTWTYTGTPNQYLLRLKVYRDCLGIPVDQTYDICYSSTILGVASTVNAPLTPAGPQAVPSNNCVNTPPTCPGSVGDIEVYTYEAIVDLPAASSDWTFSWTSNARNPAITTLQNPDTYSLTVIDYLDNLTAPTDNSPVFANDAYSRFCVGNAFFYEQKATDPDGDSLVFSLVDPLADPNASTAFACPPSLATVPYVSGFSATQPLASSVPITIDPNTGTVFFIPSIVQVGVICVRIDEYRNNVWIGSVRRDIQVNIVGSCNVILPSFFPNNIVSLGGSLPASCTDYYTLIVPFQEAFQCGSVVPTDFRVLSPMGIPNPVISAVPINCVNGLTDSVELTFLNPLSAGISYLWIKRGFDGNTLLSECGFPMPEALDTVAIEVIQNTISFPVVNSTVGCVFNSFTVNLSDSIYCWSVAPDGSDITVTDGAGTSFPVASAYPYCTPNGLKSKSLLVNMNGQVAGSGPFYLVLHTGSDNNTISNDCGSYLNSGDTLAIFTIDTIIPVDLGPAQNLCDDMPAPVLNSGYTNLSFQWYNNNIAIPGATDSVYVPSVSGLYSVVITSGASCAGSDTVTIAINHAPQDFLPADQILCELETLPVLNAGNPGATYQWSNYGIQIPGATDSVLVITQGGYYSVLISVGGVCLRNYDADIQTYPVAVVTLSDSTVCRGSEPLLNAANPGAVYQWYFNSNPIPGAVSQTLQTSAAGQYSVEVGTGLCAGNGSMNLTVNDVPAIGLTNTSICDYDQFPTLDASVPTSGAQYVWFDGNGNVIPGEITGFYTPTTAGNYSVQVTVPPGCSATASMTLSVQAAPVVTVSDTAICSDGQAVITTGIPGATYAWSNGATSQDLTTNINGDYIVTVTVNGCSDRDTATVQVFDYPDAPVVNCTPGSATNSPFKYIYTWSAVPNVGSYEISEDNGVTWVTANAAGTSAESHGTNAVVANFLVRALGTGLCRTGYVSDPVACPVVVANVFTPNGDGKNEVWSIQNIEQYPGNTVQIFNRWGKEVFSKSPYNNAENKFDGKDLPDGTYFYILNLGKGQDPMTGTITINR